MDYRQKIKAKLKTLPHKYQVRYALDCALEVKHLMQDPRSLKALEITELWLQGKATKDEVTKVSADASYVFNVDYNDASYAYYAAYAASRALNKPLKHYYIKLLKFIDNLTELEKVIYDIKDQVSIRWFKNLF